MKKYFFILLFVCLKGYSQELEFVVELKLKPQTNRSYVSAEVAEISTLTAKHGVVLTQTYPNAKNPELLLYHYIIGKGNRESIIKDFLATGKFENKTYEYDDVHPATCANPVWVNDPEFQNARRWPLDLIQAPCAWTITKGNPNVLIGVVDRDFETSHEDLQNKFAIVAGAVPSSPNPHGTRVSSIAAAETNNGFGVASIGYHSRIAAHRIFGNAPPINAGIWNLYQMGVPIINVSWTGTGLSRLAAEEITQNGTTLVLAAGNYPDTAHFHNDIADIPGVIVVSSVDQNNRYGNLLFTRNQWVDICAPGGWYIFVADTGNTYRYDAGSSYSAPLVAGAIALMLSVNPFLTPAQIENIIKVTADPIADGHLFPGQLGAGRLNAYEAVKAVPQLILSGPEFTCNTTENYSVTNLPSGASVTWSSSSGININSTTGVTSCSTGTSCSGWIKAVVTVSGIQYPLTKNINMGVPSTANISTNRNGLSLSHGNCDNDDLITYHGLTPWSGNNPYGITEGDWRAVLSGANPTIISQPSFGVYGTVAKINIPWFFSNPEQVEVRLKNQCGWSDWTPIYYYEGFPCGGGPDPFCPTCFEILVFPNPADDELSVVFKHLPFQENQIQRTQTTAYSVKLYDHLGNVHRQTKFTHTNNINTLTQRNSRAEPINFNVSNLKEGTYYLHVEGNGEIHKKQIIIKRN